MHIKRILIQGFRSLRQCKIELEAGKNVIIGKNSSGKTNIITAINILFGEKHPTRFELLESDFHIDSSSKEREKEIIIFARLEGDGVDEEVLRKQRGLWIYPMMSAPIHNDGDFWDVDGDVFYNIEHLKYANNSWDCMEKRYFKNGSSEFEEVLKDILSSSVYYFAFLGESSGDFLDISSDFRILYMKNNKAYVIANSQYNLREAFSISAVMPAFRDPYFQMKIVNYSWYGKLMKSIWDDASKQDEVANGLKEVLSKIEEVATPVFDQLTEDINSSLNIGFGGAKIRFRFINSSKQDMHKNVKVFIDDGIDDIINRKGSGIQSAFIIGLFTYYCLRQRSTSILVVEEPEVFLHPHARRAISRRLDEFVRIKAGQKNQVIVTTHSDDLIQVGGVETISLVTRKDFKTQCKTLSFKDDLDYKDIKGILKMNASEMLFADKVIICEGAEAFLLPRIADEATGKYGLFDDENISVISAEGKNSIALIVKILDKLDIDWYAVADFDFLDNSLANFLKNKGSAEEDLSKKVEEFHIKAKRVLGNDLGKAFKGKS